MAVELCSEVSSSISPRISFSHDFSQSDFIPVEQKQQHPFGSDPSSDHLLHNTDFDFCVTESFDLESLPAADEFFSDGRILPTEVKTSKINTNNNTDNNNNSLFKKKGQLLSSSPHPPPPLPPPSVVNNHHHNYNGSSSSSSNFKNLKKDHGYKEGKCFNSDEVCDNKQSNGSSKSFWSFKRSSSCGNGYRRSLCPLPLLSRSNSTGSTSPEVNKRNSLSKEGQTHNTNNSKQNSSQKHSSSSFTRCSSPSVGPNIYQKPPLNYSKNGSYGNSVRVSPVLNVHSANLFGLGSIFSNNNRDKINKKK